MTFDWPPPATPAAWYHVCGVDELRHGAAISRDVGGVPMALFRTATGALNAIDAHCGHLGANLGQGDVTGERLRCPLHHREYDGLGRCVTSAGVVDAERGLTAYPVVERFGAVFAFNAPVARFEPPALANGADVRVSVGRRVRLACSWYAAVANGFDLDHLSVVHKRELREPPVVERLDEHRFRLRYVARVSGYGLADRLMRRLSADSVRATITCWGGSVVIVESGVGGRRASLVLCLAPSDDSVDVLPIFCVPRTRIGALAASSAWLTRYLYTSFLERDVRVLDRMRFRPNLSMPEDEALAECLSFLGSLPDARERG